MRILALVPLFALGCGNLDDTGVEEQATATQGLIEGGDTVEEAGGDAVDDDVALDEAGAGDCRNLRERAIARYDDDGDGVLSEAERGELRADVENHPRRGLERHRVLRRAIGQRVQFVYDADDSGALDEAERALLKSDLQARCAARKAQILERYDSDGDGALSDPERAQLRADRQARIAARRAEILARFDENGSGRLEDDERQALRADVRDRMQAKRAALLERFDGDVAALREHLRARIRLEVEPDAETEL